MKPQLIEPLAVGIWQVYIALDSKVIARLTFPVMPLTLWKNKPISEEKSRELNSGPKEPYRIAKEFDKWREILNTPLQKVKNQPEVSFEFEIRIKYNIQRILKLHFN